MKHIRDAVRVSALGMMVFSSSAWAQEPESDVERDARLARRGAGIRVGVWAVERPAGDTTSTRSPLFEGYFQRGLDRHLALESSAAVWRRTTTARQTFGGDVETRTYVVPLFTALKLYPFTTPDNALEHFVTAGVGFALGIDDVGENAIGGGGTSIVTGFGFKGGAGIEYHIGSALGLQASGRYQWIRYGDELAGVSTFKGIGYEGGITYRFQF
ncbi:MAG: outer membrane protein [Gemmatimonadota bacterium]